MSLIEKISHYAKTSPDDVALECGQIVVTYADLDKAVAKQAQQLKEEGCTRLGISGDNSASWIIWDLAAMKAGVPCVPLPPFFTIAQTTHTAQTAGLSHVTSDGALTRVRADAKQIPLPNGTWKITFTSGSTGTPKGVCLTRQGMEDVANSLAQTLGSSYAGRHFCTLPLSILLENVAGVYTALTMGATVCVSSLTHIGFENPFQPNFAALAKAIAASRATSLILVPELLRGLVTYLSATGHTLPHLKFVAVGGAKVAPELIAHAHKVGLPVYEGYGLSECASVVSLNTPSSSKTGSAGKILPHIKARAENNEVIIQSNAFAGYLGNAAPVDHAIATGDLGEIDADGFVTLHGRKKNVIITGYGRNISPEWVESHLLAQPAIGQAVVYGDGAASLSALIVPLQDSDKVSAAIQAANALLPDYAHVKNIQIVNPFTSENGMLTGNGRIRRDAILQAFTSERKIS